MRRAAERDEFNRGLAFQDIDELERVARRRAKVQPVAGFGPRGGRGEDNISIIVAPSPGLVYAPILGSDVS
jgi:hypothetical protein